MKTTLLMAVLFCTAVLVGFTSIAAVYVLNERRDQQLRQVQRIEAWARYETSLSACERGNVLRVRINGLTAADQGERIPLIECVVAIPKPGVPRPEGQ